MPVLSVAIGRVFGSAMKGVSKGRQDLADSTLPLVACLSAVPSRGGESFLRGLFEPLGYEVQARRIVLDERFPEWGEGNCFQLRLRGKVRLAALLTHLYVLIPVLDNQKHYWVSEDEVEKLLEKGAAWLEGHPLHEQSARSYLKHKKSLFRDLGAGHQDELRANQTLSWGIRRDRRATLPTSSTSTMYRASVIVVS